jgi:hypothetical protein
MNSVGVVILSTLSKNEILSQVARFAHVDVSGEVIGDHKHEWIDWELSSQTSTERKKGGVNRLRVSTHTSEI